jgi:hypothetical protein
VKIAYFRTNLGIEELEFETLFGFIKYEKIKIKN